MIDEQSSKPLVEEIRQKYIDFALSKTKSFNILPIEERSVINRLSNKLANSTILPEDVWNIIKKIEIENNQETWNDKREEIENILFDISYLRYNPEEVVFKSFEEYYLQ